MTLKDIAIVMGDQFVAVKDAQTEEIFFSGKASRTINHSLGYCKVVSVKAPKNEHSARIITVK